MRGRCGTCSASISPTTLTFVASSPITGSLTFGEHKPMNVPVRQVWGASFEKGLPPVWLSWVPLWRRAPSGCSGGCLLHQITLSISCRSPALQTLLLSSKMTHCISRSQLSWHRSSASLTWRLLGNSSLPSGKWSLRRRRFPLMKRNRKWYQTIVLTEKWEVLMMLAVKMLQRSHLGRASLNLARWGNLLSI